MSDCCLKLKYASPFLGTSSLLWKIAIPPATIDLENFALFFSKRLEGGLLYLEFMPANLSQYLVKSKQHGNVCFQRFLWWINTKKLIFGATHGYKKLSITHKPKNFSI